MQEAVRGLRDFEAKVSEGSWIEQEHGRYPTIKSNHEGESLLKKCRETVRSGGEREVCYNTERLCRERERQEKSWEQVTKERERERQSREDFDLRVTAELEDAIWASLILPRNLYVRISIRNGLQE
ncbi:hypothetical protein CRG98_041252 [Punica granatum]|uniref:Uncharacterized protein n=1 Tax=Punica granatum TaxID=22663 RepID=A0A2I0I2Z5_PUNGR|nr:hypothetical protein CRG98_041252 [Punica granatum]